MGQEKKEQMKKEDNGLSYKVCKNLGCRVPYDEIDIFNKTGYCGDCAAKLAQYWKEDD